LSKDKVIALGEGRAKVAKARRAAKRAAVKKSAAAKKTAKRVKSGLTPAQRRAAKIERRFLERHVDGHRREDD
jgi:hypothetical protein